MNWTKDENGNSKLGLKVYGNKLSEFGEINNNVKHYERHYLIKYQDVLSNIHQLLRFRQKTCING